MRKSIVLIFVIFSCTVLKAQVIVNRYAESKVTDRGIFGLTNLEKEIIFHNIDVNQIVEKLKTAKNLKFAEPIIVDVSPIEQMQWETTGDYSIGRLKIVAVGSTSIALQFDKLFLSRNAELFLYDTTGTILTGPITEKENKGMWLSNIFQGNSVILELKVPKEEKN